MMQELSAPSGLPNGLPNAAQSAVGGIAPPVAMPDRALRFRLGNEQFAIDILLVREIRSYEAPTRIAGAAPELLGLIDLRGTVIPVIDLGCRLGMPPQADRGVIVVVDVGSHLAGIVVDAVEDVQDVPPEQVHPVPPLRVAQSHCLLGLVSSEIGLVQLMDIARLLQGTPPAIATH